MKSKFIFIAVIAFSLSMEAQIFTPGGVIQGGSTNNNVGIGTSSTVAKLTIQAGPDGYPTPLKAISIWGPNSPENSNSAQDISWDFAAAGSAVIRSFRGGGWDTYLQFLTNNDAGNSPQIRMHINGNGNVGIGTINPLAKFEVNGGNLLVRNIANTDGVSSIMVAHSVNINNFDNTGTSIRTITQNAGGNNYALQFFTEDSYLIGQTEKLRILGNGNVGIGILNPSNKLDVNGTIHSKEVKVDMNGWSDFVFKKEYNLPTLQEVEKHINEKGHLENIPSEEEVLKNGINLGEMNAKLLQKIEEVTLHLIEKDKQINFLLNENTVIKRDSDEFRKLLLNRLETLEKKTK